VATARRMNAAGLALLKRWESLRLKAYVCPAGVLTIGYGHTGDVQPHHVISEHQADVILGHDLERFEAGVAGLTEDCGLTDNEFSACVSLAYNIGLTAFGSSTLLRRLRAGDKAGAAEQFAVWRKAGGKVLAGLVSRRADERALFLSAAKEAA
jgi:lysozyme